MHSSLPAHMSATGWIVLHILCFSSAAILVKTNSAEINVPEQLLVRALFTISFLGIFTSKKTIFTSSRKHWRLLLLRGFLGFVGSYGTFYSFSVLPVSIAMTVVGVTPLLVMIFGTILLREKVSIDTWIYSLIIAIAIYLVTDPQQITVTATQSNGLDIAVAAGSACATALSFLTIKALAGKAHSSLIVFWFSACSVIGFCIIAGFPYSVLEATSYTKILLCLFCILGVFSDFSKTKAYEYSPAWFVSLCSVGTIPASGVFAWVVLDQSLLPTQWLWIFVMMLCLSLAVYRARDR